MRSPFRARYAPDPASVARARHEAARHFSGALSPEQRHALALILSELVTNAVRHGAGAVEVRLDLDDGVVRGEVVDEGPGFERALSAAGPEDLGGRGLPLVDHLAAEWGVFDGSAHVWFHLPVAAPAAPDGDLTTGRPEPDALPDA